MNYPRDTFLNAIKNLRSVLVDREGLAKALEVGVEHYDDLTDEDMQAILDLTHNLNCDLLALELMLQKIVVLRANPDGYGMQLANTPEAREPRNMKKVIATAADLFEGLYGLDPEDLEI